MKPTSPIPFEQFMARALYDPEQGYYARRISGIGRRGDFTTAPMLSEAPARAIAAWAAMALRETGCRDLIEVGPGEGKLAAAVLKHLPWHVRWRTRLHLVETSGPLSSLQRDLLGRKAVHHKTLLEALSACGGKAVIYSNELVDAFPVRRYEKTGEGWQEIAIHFDSRGRPVESLMSPAPLPESTGFLETHRTGQRVEVHESYHSYLQDWMPLWKSGRMLTIDYGSKAERIYHRCPRGTIRAYLLQQMLEGGEIYANPGRQDLTADVNFTDIIQWSLPWTTDYNLINFGEFLASVSNPKIPGQLTDTEGAGGAFLVLEQRK